MMPEGNKHTPETRAKMREAAKKRWAGGVSEEYRKAAAEGARRRWADPEYRARLLPKVKENGRSNLKRTPEERRKIHREWMQRKRAKESAEKIRREVEGDLAQKRARVAAIVAAARPIIERVERAKAMKNQPKPDAYGIIRKEPRP